MPGMGGFEMATLGPKVRKKRDAEASGQRKRRKTNTAPKAPKLKDGTAAPGRQPTAQQRASRQAARDAARQERKAAQEAKFPQYAAEYVAIHQFYGSLATYDAEMHLADRQRRVEDAVCLDHGMAGLRPLEQDECMTVNLLIPGKAKGTIRVRVSPHCTACDESKPRVQAWQVGCQELELRGARYWVDAAQLLVMAKLRHTAGTGVRGLTWGTIA